MENQKETSKQRKKNIVVPIVMVVASVLVAYFMSGVGPAPDTFEINKDVLKKIDSLEVVNQSLRQENIKLDSLIEDYRLRIDDLDYRFSEMVKRRMKSQEEHRQKSEAAMSENAEATQQFFKDRYNF